MTILSARGVSVVFGGVRALDGVDLDVAEGGITGIIGPNGAGKTTLFDCISGFRTPRTGSIVLRASGGGEVDLVGRAAWERTALGVGRTFQNARLFRAVTIRDILRTVQHDAMRSSGFFRSVLGTRGARRDEATVARRADEALALVGLSAHADKPPMELSTGMLRLAELAAVVTVRPRLLLLDEPASGIAQKEVEALGPLLKRIASHLGATVLMIEHDMPLVMGIADTIVAMAEGRVVTSGTPAEVRAHPDVLRSYLGSEALA
jgi:ABC-type branched-subunit amino acid transport system ATPase component